MSETVVVVPSEETPPAAAEAAPTVAEQAAEIVETAENLAEKMARSSDESQAILMALSDLLSSVSSAMVEIRAIVADSRDELAQIRAGLEALEEAEEEEAEEIAEEIKEEIAEAAPVSAPVEIPPSEAAPETPQKRGRKWI